MPTKRDQTVEAIFSQLELLSELATTVGEANLAQRLRALFEHELATYCEAKRSELHAALALDELSNERRCA